MKNRLVAMMLILLVFFLSAGCKDSAAAAEGNTELEWNEDFMFGLKQPDGVLTGYMQEFSGHSYTLGDMTEDEVAATIQAIQDLGYTDNPTITDISYLGYHQDAPTNSLYIIHYKNQFMDEVTISSFIGTLEDGNRN